MCQSCGNLSRDNHDGRLGPERVTIADGSDDQRKLQREEKQLQRAWPAPDLFSYAIEVCGDTNRDGTADYVVSDPMCAGAGTAWVISGVDHQVIKALSCSSTAHEYGLAISYLGALRVGDDPSLAIASRDRFPQRSVVTYHVMSISHGRCLFEIRNLAHGPTGIYPPAAPPLITVQDVDGDGWNDIAIGLASGGSHGNGEVRVYSGKDGQYVKSIDAPVGVASFGESMCPPQSYLGPGISSSLVLARSDDNRTSVIVHCELVSGAVSSIGSIGAPPSMLYQSIVNIPGHDGVLIGQMASGGLGQVVRWEQGAGQAVCGPPKGTGWGFAACVSAAKCAEGQLVCAVTAPGSASTRSPLVVCDAESGTMITDVRIEPIGSSWFGMSCKFLASDSARCGILLVGQVNIESNGTEPGRLWVIDPLTGATLKCVSRPN